MNISSLNRRSFLQFSGSLLLSKTLAEASSSWLEIQVWTPTGEPLTAKTLQQLYFLNLQDEPLPTPEYRVEEGSFWFVPPPSPWAIALFLLVPDFGEITVYADNQGKGYTPKDFPLNLNWELAVSRIHRVEQGMKQGVAQGIQFPQGIWNRLDRAKTYLNYAQTNRAIAYQCPWLYSSLAESLYAGEEAVIYQAREKIKPREFLWGCNFFGYPQLGKTYTQYFSNLFNFATIPLYWSGLEPKPGELNLERIDQMVEWLSQAGIAIKGHPLVWFHEVGIPNWVQDKSYSEIRDIIAERILTITHRYANKIPYYDIINEANGIDWANQLGYSQAQFLELTQIAATATRQGNPQAYRIINHCCLWAENVAYYPPPQFSPYQYLQACLEAEIPFEAIGLQLYYPHQDFWEINRLLERFSGLGKPIHITEIGVASAATEDQEAYLPQSKGFWRQAWSPRIQADWLEKLYTLAYSKSYIHGISWWDLADINHFWPHGGLLTSQLQPKLAYFRLSRLLRRFCNR